MDDEPPSNYRKPRRLVALCGAAFAAALFTPVPATADVVEQPQGLAAPVRVSTLHTPPTEQLAESLISTGMIGIGLAMGGLVIITHRRRQW
ncbi:MAG TPA: hypothetical protein DGG94_09245 [Micromonosporaceae bacterium]|nr:hypothetical protein [Micromonosporaceae bacterium]HCU49968.1 hypothetical protein [Micromonosporaceae bacterium]